MAMDRMAMRLAATLACAGVAACTSGEISVPNDPPVLIEVPQPGMAASSSGGGQDFTSTIEGALAEGAGAQPLPGGGTPLDADTLNLTLYTIEQQKVDARVAERELADARSRLVVVQPGALPDRVEGVNVALFAQQTSNAVGERRYDRPRLANLSVRSNCGRFPTQDEAQRAFLASGGPQQDRYNLDTDGDGFACDWDPAPYRALRF